jgi:hypothetical protein
MNGDFSDLNIYYDSLRNLLRKPFHLDSNAFNIAAQKFKIMINTETTTLGPNISDTSRSPDTKLN